jgi:hypothetical protein
MLYLYCSNSTLAYNFPEKMKDPDMADKTILATVTGEFFQPVRLHYRVLDSKGLLRAFEKLRCVDHDPANDRWVWKYADEGKSLGFKHSYAQLPKNLHPIVIGSFFRRADDLLLLDLRSCERAKLAIPFFDKHVPRSVAKLTEAEVANRLYSMDNPQLSPADLFDHQVSKSRDPEAELKRIAEVVANVRGLRARLDTALKAMLSAAEETLPEIERIPVHYYEDGIQGFELALRLRQIIGMQHFSGNTAYTLSDAVNSITKSK